MRAQLVPEVRENMGGQQITQDNINEHPDGKCPEGAQSSAGQAGETGTEADAEKAEDKRPSA